MTELAEQVAFGMVGETSWSCPFSHTAKPKKSCDNVFPPVDGEKTNDSGKLGDNLAAAGEKLAVRQTTVPPGTTKTYPVQYSPHHLLPGNESWKETALKRWVDESYGHINGDIGYDINHGTNGVDLPGHSGVEAAWDGMSEDFQTRYAFAAMRAIKPYRQFHDRHPKYSAFVVNTLDAIAQKLDKATKGNTPGCGKSDCGGKSGPKFEPPFNLINRLQNVADRLEGHLLGAPSGWRMPIFTSRFALMLKKEEEGLSQDEARKQMSNFKV